MSSHFENQGARKVANWILIGVAMVIVQVILGGVTRLTGSGLSITEWDVITGTLPPLTHQSWQATFEKYKQTPQFQLLNFDMDLGDFKFIFFWEWFHRLWARLIGVVFLIPFFLFLRKGYIKNSMVKPLIILFLLGALQGAVGWIMVASGLTGNAIYVAPVKLGLHFVLALALFAYLCWFALELWVPRQEIRIHKGLHSHTWSILVLLFIQLFFGALMAGHKAATAAPTWPDINGEWLPQAVSHPADGWLSVIESKISIHFIHRGIAYVLFVLVVWQSSRLLRFSKSSGWIGKTWYIPLLLVVIQVLLGILTVVTSPEIVPGKWGLFEWLAQIHQVVALFLLMSQMMMAYLIRRKA